MKGLTPTVTASSESSDPKLSSLRPAQGSPSQPSFLSSVGQTWSSCWQGFFGCCLSADYEEEEEDKWIRDRKKYIHTPSHAATSFYATSTPQRMKAEPAHELQETR